MRQCCKAMVNNSLIQPRGLSAWHSRPSPAPRRRRKFIRDLRGALAECRTLLITLSVYCCAAPHQDRVPMDRRPALFGVSFVARHGTECSVGERVSVGQLTEAPGNSKNSTTFWGAPKDVVPGNLDRTEGTCLELAVDLLIPRTS